MNKKIIIIGVIFLAIILFFIIGSDYDTIKGVELRDEISSWESGPYTFIQGNIENKTNKDVKDYAVIVEVYDDDGDFVIVASKTNQDCITAQNTEYFDVRFRTEKLNGKDVDLDKCKVFVVSQETYDKQYND